MPHVGRRTFFLWGLAALIVIFFAIGGIGVPQSTSSLSWAIASLHLVSAFFAYLCMEPVIFAVVSEIPSSLLRSKSVALARFTYAAINIGATVLTSYQLNPSAWAWGARSGFFGVALLRWVCCSLTRSYLRRRTGQLQNLIFCSRKGCRQGSSHQRRFMLRRLLRG